MISALTNLGALIGVAALNRHNAALAKSMERLATGQRINRASDDPAGMAAGDSLKAELNAITRQIDRLTFEEKRLGAIEGAESVITDLLLELSGLVVSAASTGGAGPREREAAQESADAILKTLNHLAANTTFDGNLIIAYRSSKSLGLAALARGGEENLINGDLEKAQKSVEDALASLTTSRAGVGIRQNDIHAEVQVLRAQFENLTAARSLIMDTDYAAEMAEMVRRTMLREAARFVTQLALEQNRSVVLKLLS